MASDVNLNHANCLRSVSDFGKTTVHNICNGATSEVPWGSADWTLAIFLIAFGGAVALLFAGIGISIIRDRL